MKIILLNMIFTNIFSFFFSDEMNLGGKTLCLQEVHVHKNYNAVFKSATGQNKSWFMLVKQCAIGREP